MVDTFIVLAVAESTQPAGPVRVGLGAIVLTIAFAAFLAWVGYLLLNARRRSTPAIEETPPNLQPWLSDDELESTRLTRVLAAAVISAAVLAVSLPVYWANESHRQAAAAEAFDELDIEEGERWWEKFACVDCHGPAAGGGAASFTEPRSGVGVSWAAPSLNDVFFRFSADEIRTIIVYGRDGTPMPSNGLEGGGAMTVQEVDQVMAFIEQLQISQGDALAKIDNAVALALSRLEDGEATVEALIARHRADREDIADAPGRFAVIGTFPDDIVALLSASGTCTEVSAALVDRPCRDAGQDTDRDGLADDAEVALTAMAATLYDNVLERNDQLELVRKPVYDIWFNTEAAFTNETESGVAIPDLEQADALITALKSDRLTLDVQTSKQTAFLAVADSQIAYLEKALEERAWDIDFALVAADMTSRSSIDAATVTDLTDDDLAPTTYSSADAEKAVGLFNAFCARCHTAGYSAGVAFEQGHGSGAWGPSLQDARSLTQFQLSTDQISFVIRGTNFGEAYGANGLGSGRMPGFGQILTRDDIELIVAFERTL